MSKKNDQSSDRIGGAKLSIVITLAVALILLLSAGLLYITYRVYEDYNALQQSTDLYVEDREIAARMKQGSDELTENCRRFVITGDVQFLNDYFDATPMTTDALYGLRARQPESEGADALEMAMNESRALMVREIYAMRLVLFARDISIAQLPTQLRIVQLKVEDWDLTSEEKEEKARLLLFDDEYAQSKQIINDNVQICATYLQTRSMEKSQQIAAELNGLLTMQRALIILLIVSILLVGVALQQMAFHPLAKSVDFIFSKKPLHNEGAYEFRVLARAYNAILAETSKREEELEYSAMHDPLTGLYNRRGYEYFSERVDLSNGALLMIDIDFFKQVNDTYGHATGDRLLVRVADLLRASFRTNDLIFRPAGDEFILLMNKVNPIHRELIQQKIARINNELQNPRENFPACSISVGVAFGDPELTLKDMMQLADDAMYCVKYSTKCGVAFAE